MESELENFTSRELVIEAPTANKRSLLLMFPITVLLATPYWFLWKQQFTLEYFSALAKYTKEVAPWWTAVAFVLIIVGIIAHEVIHGITWGYFAKNGMKSIRYGVLWTELIPYCHCVEPLILRNFRIGILMPAIVLGAIPTLTAYVTGHLPTFVFGVFFTLTAAGDFMMIYMLRDEPSSSLVQDHPTKIGCFIYHRNPTV